MRQLVITLPTNWSRTLCGVAPAGYVYEFVSDTLATAWSSNRYYSIDGIFIGTTPPHLTNIPVIDAIQDFKVGCNHIVAYKLVKTGSAAQAKQTSISKIASIPCPLP